MGPDIVSNSFYKEQFDAVEQCFKVIGFTLEVKNTIPASTTGRNLAAHILILNIYIIYNTY